MKQNQSNIICVHGKKGSGKSYICLRLAELIDDKFSVNHVVFTPKELYEILRSKPRRGTVIVYEEIGTSANARDAQRKTNKHLSFINQVWRTKNVTVLFNTPLISFVDKQIRNLFDFEITPLGYDGITKISRFKFLQNFPNPRSIIPIQKHLIFSENGASVKFVEWRVKIPSEQLCEAYEAKRDAYLDQLIEDGFQTLETGIEHRAGVKQAVQKKPKLIPTEVADRAENDKSCYMNGKISSYLIRNKFMVSQSTADKAAAYIRAKLKAKKLSDIITNPVIK